MADIKLLERLISEPLMPNAAEWAMDAESVLSDLDMLSSEAAQHIANVKSFDGSFKQHNDAVVAFLKRALKAHRPIGIDSACHSENQCGSSVFIVHGHDPAMKSEVARVLEQQGIDVLVLSEQPVDSTTIIEKLERYAKQSAFAVVLYSKDDSAATGLRARQNVVFEHGLFVGILGRNKVVAMKNGDVEGYSDIAGVEYIHYDDADWKYKLVDSLRYAGFDVSRDKIKG